MHSCRTACSIGIAAERKCSSHGKIGSIGVRLVDIPNAKDVTLFARPSGRESNLLKNHPDGVVSEKEDGSASTVADFENAMKALEGVIAPTTAAGSGTETDPYQIPKGSKFYVAIDITTKKRRCRWICYRNDARFAVPGRCGYC